MKRGAPLRRTGWLKRGSPLRRATPLARVNEERLSARKAKQYGVQADACRGMPCAACGAPPPSDPEHTRTRGAMGLDRACVPLCRPCHVLRHAHGLSYIAKRFGVDLLAVAERLARRYHGA